MKICMLLMLVIGTCFSQEVVTTSTDKTTTTTDKTTTTTPAPDTTTTPETTTATTPETTTVTPTTTTQPPSPAPSSFYRFPSVGVPCIMLTGDFRATVQYTDDKQEIKRAVLKVPVPSVVSTNVTISGKCLTPENTSFISLHWGPERSNFTVSFNLTSDSKWELSGISLERQITAEDFPGAADEGKTIRINGSLPGLSHVSIAVNKSLSCRSVVESSDFSAQVAASNETYKVTATALGYKFEAFNTGATTDEQLQDGAQCSQDDTSDLIPLAVGVALAGLVLIVLISYLVGRRRRASAYQSV